MNAPSTTGETAALEESRRKSPGTLLVGPGPKIARKPAETIGKIPSDDEKDSPGVQKEARHRLVQILAAMPNDLRPYVEFELQELKNGKLPEGEASVLEVQELETILYAETLPKADIRFIIAGIRHRARAVQKLSEERAKERKSAAKRTAAGLPPKR